jgi:hypothetical protein
MLHPTRSHHYQLASTRVLAGWQTAEQWQQECVGVVRSRIIQHLCTRLWVLYHSRVGPPCGAFGSRLIIVGLLVVDGFGGCPVLIVNGLGGCL